MQRVQRGWLNAQQWVATVRQSIMKSAASELSAEAHALTAALLESEEQVARELQESAARSFDAKSAQCRGSVRAVSGTPTTAILDSFAL